MTTVHKNMTGADLHEPKGVASAISGKVYVSDGLGSGVWTAASDVVTNTAFTTGDLKTTHKVTADTGWIMWTDQTIGDGSSGATNRANADTATLYALYWNNYSNTLCPVLPSGRGASAIADFAAHKTIALPKGAGRAIGLSGSGSGLTARTVGDTVGSETSTLVAANLPPYTPAGTIANGAITIGTPNTLAAYNTLAAGNFTTGSFGNGPASTPTASQATSTFTGTPSLGTSAPFANMPPTAWVNTMIKL